MTEREQRIVQFKCDLGNTQITINDNTVDTLITTIAVFERFPETRIVNIFRRRDYLCYNVYNRNDIDELRATLTEIKNNG